MAQLHINSPKRLQIDKANTAIVIVMSIACFVTVFSLVASRTLLQQRSYQARVIEKKEAAKDQLAANLKARDQLVEQFKAFISPQQNVIGGSSVGEGAKDGDNAKLVLDALPSKYDFPALTTSIDALITANGLAVKGIGGTDNEVEQSAAIDNSEKVEIPFELSALGDFERVQSLLLTLDKSIRPMQIKTLLITGDDESLNLSLSASTYYQPEKKLKITKEVVK